jgi:cytochrome c-type biogenesis protein CcmH/NrfG
MMTDALFALNLVTAAALAYVLWRREKMRSMVVFHVVGLAVAATLYALMVWRSAAAEMKPNVMPVLFLVRTIVAAVAYVPFLVFLVVTYVRVLGALAAGGISTREIKLEEAVHALRFGHHNQAARTAQEVLAEDPDNIEARMIMAEVHLSRGQYEKAIGSYRLAMPVARDNAEFAQLVFTVAVILNEHMGDDKGAMSELDLIRKRMPGTPQAEKAQKWIFRIMDRAAREG